MAKYGSSVQIFSLQIKSLHLNSMEQKQRHCKHCFFSGVLLGIAISVRSLLVDFIAQWFPDVVVTFSDITFWHYYVT